MIFYFFYILALLLLLSIILKLVSYHLLDESITFFLITNYILNIAIVIFFCYFENYLFSLFFLLALLIFALFLLKDLRRIIGYIPLRSIPYLLLVIFSFVKVLILFFQTI